MNVKKTGLLVGGVAAATLSLAGSWSAASAASPPFSKIAISERNDRFGQTVACKTEFLDAQFKIVNELPNLCASTIWFDNKANFYAIIPGKRQGFVQEYAAGSLSPTTAYPVLRPAGIATDAGNNVYSADGASGEVEEFVQGSTTVAKQCPFFAGPMNLLTPTGVAVDGAGDVFVAAQFAFTSPQFGEVVEFKGGLTGCRRSVLGVQYGAPSQLLIDSGGNLLAADLEGGVQIAAPPFTSATRSIQGVLNTSSFSLTPTNAMIFIADQGRGDVFVDSYPSGTPLGTLGASNGIQFAIAVAVTKH